MTVQMRMILIGPVLFWLAACQAPPIEPDPSAPTAPTAPSTVSVTFLTEPPGGKIRVEEQRLEHGEIAGLLPGTYQASATREGFRVGATRFTVTPGENRTVVVELGPSFGTVAFDVRPADARVRIDGRTVDPSVPRELAAGEHRFEAAKAGHYPAEDTFRVSPGSRQTISIELDPLPAAAPAEFTAHHPEAGLLLDGSEIGTGAVKLESLEFGTHRLESVRPLDSWRREFAAAEFTFERDGPDAFEADPARIQWRFEDQWLALEQARAAENARYETARVDRPAKLTVAGNQQLVRELAALGNPAGWLHRHMQIGDRLRVSIGDDQWTLWKRAPEPQPAFIESVEGFTSGQAYPLPWDDDIIQVGLANRIPASQPHDLVYALVTASGKAPLLDLEQTVLRAAPSQSVSIATAASDRGVELIAHGGAGLILEGETLQSDAAQTTRRTINQPGTYTLQWQIPPQRIAVIPASGTRRDDTNAEPLKANEKRLIELDAPSPPTAVVQITVTLEGEEATVSWERIETAAGPAGGLDLRKVEIGPHARPGAYRRIWIIEYPTAIGTSQRQYQRRYSVAPERIQTETDVFLRRKADEIQKIMDEDT